PVDGRLRSAPLVLGEHRDQLTARGLDLVDGMVAEVAELPHGAAQLVDAGGAHRLLAEAHLLGSQRDPDALTDAEVSRVIDHELPADFRATRRDQARVAG